MNSLRLALVVIALFTDPGDPAIAGFVCEAWQRPTLGGPIFPQPCETRRATLTAGTAWEALSKPLKDGWILGFCVRSVSASGTASDCGEVAR